MKTFLLLMMFFLTSLLISSEMDKSLTLKKSSADSLRIVSHVFDDIDDDYMVAKIFFNYKQRKDFKGLDDNLKRSYLDNFWSKNDPNPVTLKNEFVELIKSRIEYCNKFFSHFKDGWTTDRGRIYIKHGQPYEVIKEKSGLYARYGTKDYEIWKYRVDRYMTFIFFDIQTHGDYRLIYSDNDDRESSLPDWRDFLGEDFDEGILY